MDEQARSLDKTAIACGLLAIAGGVFIFLSAFGVIPSRGGTDGGHWIGVSAGLAFVLGGIAVVIQSCAKATPGGELPSSTPIWVRLTLRPAIVSHCCGVGGDRNLGCLRFWRAQIRHFDSVSAGLAKRADRANGFWHRRYPHMAFLDRGSGCWCTQLAPSQRIII
jgi:hypothetical protein